jgi:hypothetical protein
MKRHFYLVLAAVLVLSSCAPNRPYHYSPAPLALTDQQIVNMDDGQLCVLAENNLDPRINAEYKKRKPDCDPISRSCKSQGFMSGSKKFAACVVLEKKKLADPAFAYCYDEGFKIGTQPMATCIASWNEQQQQQRALDVQERQQQQEQANEEQKKQQQIAACKAARMLIPGQTPTMAALNAQGCETGTPAYIPPGPPPPQPSKPLLPTQTNCRFMNGSMDCTTY